MNARGTLSDRIPLGRRLGRLMGAIAGLSALALSQCHPRTESLQPSAARTRFHGIGVELRMLAPVLGIPVKPEGVLFARTDFLAPSEMQFIRSDTCYDTRCYLDDPVPGTYVVTAVVSGKTSPFDRHDGTVSEGKITCLPSDVAERTKTVLGNEGAVFAGRFVLRLSMGLDEDDRLQVRCRDLLTPRGFARVIAPLGRIWYRGGIVEEAKDEAAADAFFRAAERDLPRFSFPESPGVAPQKPR